MGEWNDDMSQAPRDGAKFCATDGTYCFTTFRHKSYTHFPDENGLGAEFRWHWSYIDKDSVSEWKPTHWMYLPEPPQEEPKQ